MALIEDCFEDTLLIVRGDSALVVPHAERWGLPVVRTRDHHPADVRKTRQAIRAELGIDAFILACREVEVHDGVARRLLEAEPLIVSGDGARQDQRWVAASDVADMGHRAVLNGRDWTRPGWFARATAWLKRQAATGGWTIRRVEQIRAWEFSCVLRVETDQGELYLKALPRTYAAEVPLVQQLAAWHPAHLPAVVGVDLRQRWALLRGCGGRCLEDGASLADWQRVVRAYAELQVASAARIDRLRALGCRDRSPSALRAALGPLFADEAAFLVEEENGLTSAELQRLRAWQPWLESACDELGASSLPLTLEHGDLWASNIFVGDGEPKFIDWTDACLSHPFLSLGPLLRSAAGDPQLADQANASRRIGDAYLGVWSTFATLEELRRLLALAEPLAALHIAVSYWSLTPRPHQQWWMARGVPFFARMALELLPRAGVP